MNRAYLPALPSWASPSTWDSLARDRAVWAGRELLRDEGASGWDWSTYDLLRGHSDQLVREAVTTLGVTGQRWSPYGTAKVLCRLLDIHGAVRDVAERIRIKT